MSAVPAESTESTEAAPAPAPRWRAHPAILALSVVFLGWLFLLPRFLGRPSRAAWWSDKADSLGLWRPGLDPWVLTGEVLLALALVARWPGARRPVTAALWGLGLLELNRMGGQLITKQVVPFYDELFLLKHLGVLVSDLASPGVIAGLLGVLLAMGLAAWAVARLVDLAATGLAARNRRTRWLLLLAAALPVAGSLWVGGPDSRATAVRWLTADHVKNGISSVALYRKVQAGLGADTHAPWRELRLGERPDVRVMVVESYGRTALEHPETAPLVAPRLAAWTEARAAEGWTVASGWSRTPVSGGRSWLSDATALAGFEVGSQAEYRHLLGHLEGRTTLVSLFQHWGYQAVYIAPVERARPGIELTNEWGYDQLVRFAELDYRGPPMGWGRIPDQYALRKAEEELISADRPRLQWFHMVSAHAPWRNLPELVDDWRSLQELPVTEEDLDAVKPDTPGPLQVLYRLKHFKRQTRNFYMGAAESLEARRYGEAIAYDLDLLDQWLREAEPGGLVVILGDHQPPFLGQAHSFSVPVHLLARDERLLEPWRERGFVPGMVPASGAEAVGHEELLGLLAAGVAACCAGP